MSKEIFLHLLEIQGLNGKIFEHRGLITEHQKRVEYVKSKREEKLEQLSQLKNELEGNKNVLATLEKDLFTSEEQLKKTQEHISMANCEKQVVALEHELEALTPKIDTLENESLELLDKNEAILTDIKEAEEFITGVEQTIPEIEKEVTQDIEKEEREIDGYNQRINALLDQGPKNILDAYTSLSKKYREKGFLTFINNHCCTKCGYQVSRVLESDIEKTFSIEYCSGCGRIIVPYSAKS